MDKDFWVGKWQANDIAFHEGEANVHLVANFSSLGLPSGRRVFVPLCGKTRDIAWLLAEGFAVAGAELSELAVQQLFEDLGVEPTLSKEGALTRYSAEGIDIFAGDIFELTAESLGPVDAVYDRAALVALPDDLRRRYAAHLQVVTGTAPQFLITFIYDQSLVSGPPFSVPEGFIRDYYGAAYTINHILTAEVPGGVRGEFPADEAVWVLQPKA